MQTLVLPFDINPPKTRNFIQSSSLTMNHCASALRDILDPLMYASSIIVQLKGSALSMQHWHWLGFTSRASGIRLNEKLILNGWIKHLPCEVTQWSSFDGVISLHGPSGDVSWWKLINWVIVSSFSVITHCAVLIVRVRMFLSRVCWVVVETQVNFVVGEWPVKSMSYAALLLLDIKVREISKCDRNEITRKLIR